MTQTKKKPAHGGPKERAEHKLERDVSALKEEAEHTTEDVLHAFRKGRSDAMEAAQRTLPAVKKSISKSTYMLCYYLSFGAVYGAELAMAAVPEDSVIRHGFKDGAAAAREAYGLRAESPGHHVAHEAAV